MSRRVWTFPPPPPPFYFFIYTPPIFIFGFYFLRCFPRLYRTKKREVFFFFGTSNNIYCILFPALCICLIVCICIQYVGGFYSLRGFCVCFGLILFCVICYICFICYTCITFLFYTYIVYLFFGVFFILRFFNFF